MLKRVKIRNKNTLVVDDVGPSDPKGTIIAVHGLTGNHMNMQLIKEEFQNTYRFITYDARGRGNSSEQNENSSIFDHAEDLLSLVDVMNIEKPILLGYSMGGYICSLVAAQLSEVAGLVLLDGAGEVGPLQKELIPPSLERIKKVYKSLEDYLESTKVIYEKLKVRWNERVASIAEYEMEEKNGAWVHKSNVEKIVKDFETFYEFRADITIPSVQCDILLVIAKGKLGKKPSLFSESSYNLVKEHAKHVQVVLTEANHYTLIFEKQPALYREIHSFLQSRVGEGKS